MNYSIRHSNKDVDPVQSKHFPILFGADWGDSAYCSIASCFFINVQGGLLINPKKINIKGAVELGAVLKSEFETASPRSKNFARAALVENVFLRYVGWRRRRFPCRLFEADASACSCGDFQVNYCADGALRRCNNSRLWGSTLWRNKRYFKPRKGSDQLEYVQSNFWYCWSICRSGLFCQCILTMVRLHRDGCEHLRLKWELSEGNWYVPSLVTFPRHSQNCTFCICFNQLWTCTQRANSRQRIDSCCWYFY